MANNQYVNKVEYFGQTLLDLSGDGITPSDLRSGVTAHDRSGAPITGTYVGSTLRAIPFTVELSDWSSSNNIYTATVSSAYVTSTSIDFVIFDDSKRLFIDDVTTAKASGGGGIVFSTGEIPVDDISGTIYVVDNDDGKTHMIIENTIMPIANGGTGASSMTGAQTNLGIVYSENEPSTPVTGMIWLKPTE